MLKTFYPVRIGNWRSSARSVARFVLVFLSQNSVSKRGYIQKEISRALDVAQQIPEGEIFVIPIRLEVCSVPTRLQRWHWLDIFEPDGLERLLNVLRTTLEQEIPLAQAGGQERPWQAPPGALDLLLVNRCLERKTFVYGILPSGGVIISDGAFLEVREAIPTYFHGLEKKVKHSGEVSEASLTSSLPSATTYRKRSHLLKDIALDPSNPRLRVITTEGGLQCHVDSLYLDYVMVKYPTAHIYAHEPEKPIMVEEEQRLRAAIMPIRVTGD